MTRGAAQSAVLLAIALLPSRGAQAQEQAGSSYVLAGLAFPHQQGPSGDTPGQTYASAPGGTTAGWMAGAGLWLRRELSVEGEIASTGLMRAVEPSRYFQTFTEERRDRFFGGSVRFHLSPGSPVDVEPVVGAFVVQHSASRQVSTLTPLGQLTVDPPFALNLPVTGGFQVGADVRIGGRHFGILPSFRVRYSGAGADAIEDTNAATGWVSSTYPGGGFSRWTLSPAVAARIDF